MLARLALFAAALSTAAPAHADTARYFARGAEGAGFVEISLPPGGAVRTGTIRGSYRVFGKEAATVTLNAAATWKPGSAEIKFRGGSCEFSGQVGQCNYGEAFFTLSLAPELSRFTLLLVPGLFAGPGTPLASTYLEENLQAAQALGFEARRLTLRLEGGVLANAQAIANEVTLEASRGRRVILVGHGKGATDVTAALALYPSLHPAVAGVVAIQPLFQGSPVAELVAAGKHTTMPGVKRAVETFFQGQTAALAELTAAARATFLARYPYPAQQLRTVVVRSRVHRPGSVSALSAAQQALSLALGAESDGLLRPSDATIPGAAVTLDVTNLDHLEAGLRGESDTSPVELTKQTLFALFGLK